MKPKAQAKAWTKRISPSPEADQVSSFALNVGALHYCVSETVVEHRGEFPRYRPGDVLMSIRGGVFHR